MITDWITVSRILFSLFLLALSPSSAVFAVLYLLCGVTDVPDGFPARKLHTESERGAMLDSVADLFFAVAYAVKVLPILHLPVRILIWTVLIAAIKIVGILKRSRKEQRLFIEHSYLNKLTGFLIFFLPLTVCCFEVTYSAAVVCTVATLAAIKNDFF